MASKTKPIRKRQGKTIKPRQPPLEMCRYVMTIEDWSWSFSFGLGDKRRDLAPFRDYRHLTLRGTLLQPSRLKVRAVELTLLPDAMAGWEDWPENSPNAVGSLSLNANVDRLLQGLLSLPADALAQILTVLTADRFKYVLMYGDPLRHRRALIRNYSLERTLDDDDGEPPPQP